MRLTDLARENGLKVESLAMRLKRGWGLKRALSTPMRESSRRDSQKFNWCDRCTN